MQELGLVNIRSRPQASDRVPMVTVNGQVAHLCSAVWQVKGLYGLFIHRIKLENKPSWRIRYHAVANSGKAGELALRVAEKTEGELYRTRTEALQAVHAAYLTLDESL